MGNWIAYKKYLHMIEANPRYTRKVDMTSTPQQELKDYEIDLVVQLLEKYPTSEGFVARVRRQLAGDTTPRQYANGLRNLDTPESRAFWASVDEAIEMWKAQKPSWAKAIDAERLAGATPEAASKVETFLESVKAVERVATGEAASLIVQLDGVAANYPVDTVRCAYERGLAERAASLRAQIEQLPRYAWSDATAYDHGELIERNKVLALLDATETR